MNKFIAFFLIVYSSTALAVTWSKSLELLPQATSAGSSASSDYTSTINKVAETNSDIMRYLAKKQQKYIANIGIELNINKKISEELLKMSTQLESINK